MKTNILRNRTFHFFNARVDEKFDLRYFLVLYSFYYLVRLGQVSSVITSPGMTLDSPGPGQHQNVGKLVMFYVFCLFFCSAFRFSK